MNHIRTAACSAAAATAAACVLALAAPAHAHVTVNPDEAEQGGYTTLGIKVPNERDNASTVGIELHLDPDHPVASVMPQPVPGWDVEVETAELEEPLEAHGGRLTEAPSVVTWSGGEIEPGTFQQFPLSVGPLPEDTDRMVFKAIQTYDSGEVVRWIEEPADGGEPDFPAAVLSLAAGDGGHHGGGSDAGESGEENAEESEESENAAADSQGSESSREAAASSDGSGSDTTARVLAVLGIVIGLAGIPVGAVIGSRAARRGAATPAS